MQWIGWIIAIAAALGAGLLFVRLRDERRVLRRVREDLADAVAEIEQLQATRQRLAGAAQLATLGQLAGCVATTVESPLSSARSNVAVVADLIEDYRRLVKGYDAAVQHCLQPVEMIFGADKAGLDQLVKHVEEARRKLFIARVALEKSSALGESKQLLAGAVDGLARSTDLVDGLRRVAGNDQEQVQPVDVNETLAAVLTLVGTQWGERIEIVREFGELPTIRAVPGQLARAFVQLAINAGHAMPGSGRLLVQTRMHGARSIEVDVTDSGGGIADEVLPLIFEPYFSTRASALGLGLASVRGIVKAHGGSVNVRTTAELGSTFTLTLPLEASPAAASAADGFSQF
ncbi:MAG: ATP-binding protein [Dokdonella sp.]